MIGKKGVEAMPSAQVSQEPKAPSDVNTTVVQRADRDDVGKSTRQNSSATMVGTWRPMEAAR